MNREQKLREAIKAMVHEMLDEISTTGDVAGYLTPKAFSANSNQKKKHAKHMAAVTGYELTDDGEDDTKVDLTENMYYEYKNDKTMLPHQKIGKAVSEMNKQIKSIEKMLHFNNRLKNEYGIANEALWERTKKQMTKLEGRLIEMSRRLREMRG
jgi:hypothetical protein